MQMPDWEPNRAKVEWDHGAAEAAIAALRRAADKLDLTTTQRERVAGKARNEWRGRYRESFDDHFRQVVSRAGQLTAEYRDAANRIARASQMAWEEQRRRAQEIARWEAEKAAEERERRWWQFW
jgi:uncharacterized membrane-anchored protein YhcB (DUF1043 family)